MAEVLQQQLFVLAVVLPGVGFSKVVGIAFSGLGDTSLVLPAVLRYLQRVVLMLSARSPLCYN